MKKYVLLSISLVLLVAYAALVVPALASGPSNGTVSFDFEDKGLQGWNITAGDFRNIRQQTAQCPASVQSAPTGRYLLSTDYRQCGTAESPVFVVQGNQATFLLGGAGRPHAYLSLHGAEDDQELMRSDVPVAARDEGDEWELFATSWDLSELVDHRVYLKIVADPIGYSLNRRGNSGHHQESSVVFDNFEVDGFIDWKATEDRRVRVAAEKRTSLDGIRENIDEIVFAVRKADRDSHWYADFGHWSGDPNRVLYHEGTRLCVWNAESGEVSTLLEDALGTIRDPQVHYDAQKVLFSYRPGGSEHFNLYEIDILRTPRGIEGVNLRQLTSGDYDDLEPSYFPDGRIIFCSSRCKRFVPCYFTEVAILYSCNSEGGEIRPLSPNVEHENTPWPMPDGRILYTRWEYVERNVLDYHHLWTATPDGRNQAVFYGNMHPGYLMIDAKPIPGRGAVVSTFVPGHSRNEHAGTVTLVDPSNGPDDKSSIQRVGWSRQERDPAPVGDAGFILAKYHQLVVMDYEGRQEQLWALSEAEREAGFLVHEPQLLEARPREPVIPDQIDLDQSTGVLTLTDVYQGRNMDGIQRGSIKKLLVLESLPKALNISNGSEPTSRFANNHERILGTVPVESDGSASFEVPAMRAIFLAALDENDIAVKRMQSFLTVQPGEVNSCVGCHEERMQTPASLGVAGQMSLAMRRVPSRIEPISDIPDVFDYHRDVQPILDRHCVACHDCEATDQGGPRAGGIVLNGDLGPVWTHSYTALAYRYVTFGNNRGNNPPFTTGSGGSRLMNYLDGEHHEVQLSEHEQTMIRLWIDSGAMYAGTLAAEGTGMIYSQLGKQTQNYQVGTYDWFAMPDEWPDRLEAVQDVAERRCSECHETSKTRMSLPNFDITFFTNEKPPRPTHNIERILNLSRPAMSFLLLGPLSKTAGGYQTCRAPGVREPVFTDTDDPDYQLLLDYMNTLEEALSRNQRFNMEGFQPSPHYYREMKRYGFLPADFDPERDSIDPYEIDRQYWESFWVD